MPTPRRTPFIEARFLDALPKQHDVEHRLTDHLLRLRDDGWTPEPPDAGGGVGGKPDASPVDADDADDLIARYGPGGSYETARRRRQHFVKGADEARIARRARRYVERVTASTGLSHLAGEDVQRLKVLRDGAALVSVESEHRADEIAAALHADMPWMGHGTEQVWQAMRSSVREDALRLRLPPMLLVGPPGIGKSHWARRMGELLGMSTTVVEATGEPASFAIVGSQHVWASAGLSRLVDMVLRTRMANPLVVIDEIEKAGEARSTSGRSWNLANALLPPLERSTAAQWSCPYFRVVFDMSWVGWVMTANSTEGLPAPLLSRVPPLRLPHLAREQLIGFAQQQAVRRGLPEEVTDEIAAILESLSEHDRPSLRSVVRMVERAEAVLARPLLH